MTLGQTPEAIGPPFVHFWFPADDGLDWHVDRNVPAQAWDARSGLLVTVSLTHLSSEFAYAQWRRIVDSDPESLVGFASFQYEFSPPPIIRSVVQAWLDGCFYHAHHSEFHHGQTQTTVCDIENNVVSGGNWGDLSGHPSSSIAGPEYVT